MGIRLSTVARGLARAPGFALATVATLAAGIAASATMFSLVEGILLSPLPYPEAHRLVRVYHQAPGLNIGEDIGLSDATYLHYRDTEPLSEIGLYRESAANLVIGEVSERVVTAQVTHTVFAVLRVAPVLGRTLVAEDCIPGAEPVVVLSHDLWEARLGTDSGSLGATVDVDGEPHRVVGVMPPGFAFPEPGTGLWLPMVLDPTHTNIGSLGIDGVARLAPGWSPAQAERRLVEAVQPLEELFPVEQGSGILARAGFTTRVVGLKDHRVGGIRSSLWLLFASVGFVLLTACGNVANLFLARAESREQEMAMRSALGAGRRHLVAEFLAESVMLGLAAGAVAVPLTVGGVEALARFGPANLPRGEEVAVDGTTLGFTIAISLLCGLLLGAFPALRYDRRWLTRALAEGGRGDISGAIRARARSVLVGAQIALTLVLLVGSVLMIRSFVALTGVDPGFRAEGVVTFRVALPEADYPEVRDAAGFVDGYLESLRGLPGVEAAGAVSVLPLSQRADAAGVLIQDYPEQPGEVPKVHFDQQVSPGYFRTMGIPLRAGRVLEAADHRDPRPVVIVNEAFARLYWPDDDAVGKRLQPRNQGTPDPDAWLTIVGVVGNVPSQRLDESPVPAVYYPLASPSRSFAPRNMSFVVRGAHNPMALVGLIRERLRELDPNLPLADVRPMGAYVDDATAALAFTMAVLAIGAAGALLIGAVGIYGVISYVVARRTREIGVRLALGARAEQVSAMIVRGSLRVTLTGIAAGLLVTTALAGYLSSLLHGVDAHDPGTLATVSVFLLVVATGAAWLPARRAARLHPLVALRDP